MKVKKILGYVGLTLAAALTGALIASPELRERVGNSVKGGVDWIGGKISKKETESDPEPEEEPVENEEPRTSNEGRQENNNRNNGGYRKPRYYNNNRNNN